MYKIAVFSDIHGNLEALEAIIKDIKKDNIDEIIFLGDAIGLGPNSKECIDLLSKNNIKWILGNHDLYFIKGLIGFEIETEKIEHYKWLHKTLTNEDKDKMLNLALEYNINIDNHSFNFRHYFIKDNKLLYPFYSRGDIKKSKISDLLKMVNSEYNFYGHDHDASNYHFNDCYFIDVGSSGCTKDDKTFYTIITINKDVKIEKKYINYNRKKFEQKIRNANYPYLKHIAKGFYGIDL